MMAYVKDTLTGFYSLLAGMGVTIRYFVKPIVTVQYPREKLAMSPRYRGHTEFIIDEETGTHRCNACENCARTCPSGVISLTGAKPPGSKKKRAVTYVLEYNLCSLCGLCVEVCPTNALKFSDEYRLAGYSREDSRIDLIARLQAQQRALGLAEEVPPEPEAAEAKPEEAAAEAKSEEPKPKAKPEKTKAEAKPGEPKVEAKPEEAEAEAKPEEPKAEGGES